MGAIIGPILANVLSQDSPAVNISVNPPVGDVKPTEEQPTITPASEPPMPLAKYSFEDGVMGWVPQDYFDSKACVQVLHSDSYAKDGRYSLQMVMDLVGGDTNRSKGEAWVNMHSDPPAGVIVPADLINKTVTAWIYAPQGSIGDSHIPNGFQIFVKDTNWKSEYGSWQNVVEGKWVKISLTVITSKPKDGWIDQGFDPHQIVVVGIKMGSGGGSTSTYSGPIYVDVVDW